MVASSSALQTPQADPRAGSRGEGARSGGAGERSEPPRSGEPPPPGWNGEPPDAAGAAFPGPPDPEVLDKPLRRRFTAEYKRRVLDEADACKEAGQVGALLRREGLYSSHLSNWRRQREKALAAGLTPRKRGRKPTSDPSAKRAERLERENARLRRHLEEAKAIIDIQKKVSQLLGIKLADVSEREKRLESEENDS